MVFKLSWVLPWLPYVMLIVGLYNFFIQEEDAAWGLICAVVGGVWIYFRHRKPRTDQNADLTGGSSNDSAAQPSTPAAMRCAQCGTTIFNGQAFCSGCGMKQEETISSHHCPSCGSQVEPQVLFCRQCGTKVR